MRLEEGVHFLKNLPAFRIHRVSDREDVYQPALRTLGKIPELMHSAVFCQRFLQLQAVHMDQVLRAGYLPDGRQISFPDQQYRIQQIWHIGLALIMAVRHLIPDRTHQVMPLGVQHDGDEPAGAERNAGGLYAECVLQRRAAMNGQGEQAQQRSGGIACQITAIQVQAQRLRMAARFLHENSFEFDLQAKIFIDTNHLPNVTDQTLFESGRIKIIPFNRHFEEHEQDKTLKATLTDEEALSGIFNWAVEGYRLYKLEGLGEPEEVLAATAQYRQDSDRISQFIDSWLEEGKDEDGDKYQVPCKAAYRVYSSWCTDMNYHPENYKNFRAAMEKAYMVDRRRPKGGGEPTPLIIGVRLRKEEVGAEEEDGDVFKPLMDEGCILG